MIPTLPSPFFSSTGWWWSLGRHRISTRLTSHHAPIEGGACSKLFYPIYSSSKQSILWNGAPTHLAQGLRRSHLTCYRFPTIIITRLAHMFVCAKYVPSLCECHYDRAASLPYLECLAGTARFCTNGWRPHLWKWFKTPCNLMKNITHQNQLLARIQEKKVPLPFYCPIILAFLQNG